MKDRVIPLFIDVSESIRVETIYHVPFKDHAKAFHAAERINDFFRFAWQDEDVRERFKEANPEGYKIIEMSKENFVEGIMEIAKK